jgi:hypothetical protein
MLRNSTRALLLEFLAALLFAFAFDANCHAQATYGCMTLAEAHDLIDGTRYANIAVVSYKKLASGALLVDRKKSGILTLFIDVQPDGSSIVRALVFGRISAAQETDASTVAVQGAVKFATSADLANRHFTAANASFAVRSYPPNDYGIIGAFTASITDSATTQAIYQDARYVTANDAIGITNLVRVETGRSTPCPRLKAVDNRKLNRQAQQRFRTKR